MEFQGRQKVGTFNQAALFRIHLNRGLN